MQKFVEDSGAYKPKNRGGERGARPIHPLDLPRTFISLYMKNKVLLHYGNINGMFSNINFS